MSPNGDSSDTANIMIHTGRANQIKISSKVTNKLGQTEKINKRDAKQFYTQGNVSPKSHHHEQPLITVRTTNTPNKNLSSSVKSSRRHNQTNPVL